MEKKEDEGMSSISMNKRTFLKGVATAIGAVAATYFTTNYAFSKTILAQAKVPNAKKFLVYDPALCTGCGTCQVVCSTIWNNGKSSLFLARIDVARNPFGTTDDDYSPKPCLQCADPPCLKVCPVSALKVDNVSGTNARVIEERLCIGCGKCRDACPYGDKKEGVTARVFGINPERRVFVKCHLCYGNPQCVKYCPNGALKYKEVPDFIPQIDYMRQVTKKPMVEKSYYIVLAEDREKELSYPRVV